MFEHSLVALILLAFATVIFIPALVIGSVGAHRLATTREQQRTYTSTTCFVSNITDELLPYDCNCDGCQPSNCYAEHFAVQYQIQNGTYLSSVIHIDEIPHLLKIQVNGNYTCFYDRRSVISVHWFMPSERPAMAMLVVGFTVAGIAVLAVAIGEIVYLARRRNSSVKPNA